MQAPKWGLACSTSSSLTSSSVVCFQNSRACTRSGLQIEISSLRAIARIARAASPRRLSPPPRGRRVRSPSRGIDAVSWSGGVNAAGSAASSCRFASSNKTGLSADGTDNGYCQLPTRSVDKPIMKVDGGVEGLFFLRNEGQWHRQKTDRRRTSNALTGRG